MRRMSATHFHPIPILLAEDNMAVREFVQRALASHGYAVSIAANGSDALALLNQHAYAVLITDIVMPQMDGITLALKAAALQPELKIILISGYAQERMRAHNIDALAQRIIAKPFTMQQIADAVYGVLYESA